MVPSIRHKPEGVLEDLAAVTTRFSTPNFHVVPLLLAV
jgi:hypothetical protein